MSHFIKDGNTFTVSHDNALTVLDSLPAATYVLKLRPSGQFYLEEIEKMQFTGKIYGDSSKLCDRIMRTFDDRTVSTGVLLSGEKGSGKTMLAKMISMEAAVKGMPTIVINSPFSGDAFNNFMQLISHPCVVIFDEFEKVFSREDQEQLLTLLDGVFSAKKLFLLTCNEKYRIDSHMRNRPGRIFYSIEFDGLDASFIREYCVDNLIDQNKVDGVCRIAMIFNKFNFDMLKALVEEINRYNETPQEAIKYLNAKPEHSETAPFDVTIKHKGSFLPNSALEDCKRINVNPLSNKSFTISFKIDDAEEEDGYSFEYIELDYSNLVSLDIAKEVFIFANGDYEVYLTKGKDVSFKIHESAF